MAPIHKRALGTYTSIYYITYDIDIDIICIYIYAKNQLKKQK